MTESEAASVEVDVEVPDLEAIAEHLIPTSEKDEYIGGHDTVGRGANGSLGIVS